MARYVCLLLSVATLSCGGADRVRVIKLAHGLPISHPVHEAMVFLSERTWEASEGKIRIDVHPAEQLGTERECLELLQIGAVGMTKVSASVLENFVPRYAVFSLPYLFRDEAHRQKVFHGAIGKRILSAGAGLDRFTLLAIPFFILSGQLMNRGGMARRLIDLARGVVGMLPGGLAYVNIVAGMLFGAISGSAVAAVAAVGGFMVPRMREQGYDESFSAAVNVSSATTSLVIPPSNILIVYALAAGGVSIAALFVAGYVPGLLVGLLLMVVAGTIAKRRGYPVDARVGARELARRFFAALPSLFLVVVRHGRDHRRLLHRDRSRRRCGLVQLHSRGRGLPRGGNPRDTQGPGRSVDHDRDRPASGRNIDGVFVGVGLRAHSGAHRVGILAPGRKYRRHASHC